ncbi:NAD(+)-specific D-arabinose dehydrogenase [Hyphodiscus hymeniophilus]|uniref:NAD(+)-specific D-arabinose dehydrogenase n=1 Tax=Hyphodiscus hymeniophilus TaxID=353542 RepID=A0A9P7AX50_9HELO|nr:NAD(+)-specific D-arabinose dehydrogenase [Hyphodiscus hymeniophilus]
MEKATFAPTLVEPRTPLSSIVSKLVLGGAAFSTQLHPDPTSLPVRDIIKHALKLGFRTFDTSPYYGPSEWLLGDAFSHPDVASNYSRSEIILMTKVGRIAALEFDYSPNWIRHSVNRSLDRFKTSYLDVVFCHDIEYVTDVDAVTAVGVLFELVDQGKIRYVGVSGYSIEKLVRVANLVRLQYGRPLDAVQNWAQLTLQNTRLESEGLEALRDAGVDCIFNSSPLCIGLLRSGGVPVGSLGDFHPAPKGLREAALQASRWVESRGDNLASLALRFAISRLSLASPRPPGASTIFGGGSIWEIDANMGAAEMILGTSNETRETRGEAHKDVRDFEIVRQSRLEADEELVFGVRSIFGRWLDFGFTSPDAGWDIMAKAMIVQDEGKQQIIQRNEVHLEPKL